MSFEDLISENVKNVLLVEPDFPIPNKSRNHSNFLPIGLLKIASYLRNKSINIKLIRFEEKEDEDYYQTTIGFEFSTFNIKINDKYIRLSIWDTCGQEIYRSLITNFYRNSSLAFIVFAIDE